ncbi:MAG: hypothetical protein JWR26_1817 [Pedosphaera sp.]|nr:hypothetical protein [Pedosphaera sp.]
MPEPLLWDAVDKELAVQPGQATAEFVFNLTNASDSEFVIDRVMTSCGCTVAKIPSQPWHVAPHTNGQIGVTVNLAGKFGTFYKTITVIATNAPAKELRVKVIIPEGPEITRARNQMMAMTDHQAVFKNDCANCHVVPTKGKMAKELYSTACGICHEAKDRATMVPNLHALNHPTDYNYWKQWITNGKAGTLMPAFAEAQGGPLNDEQIESLAKTLTKAFSEKIASGPTARVNAPHPMTPGGLPIIPPTRN